MGPTEKAVRVVQRMMEHDAFSQWLGMGVVEVLPGSCVLQCTVRREMQNGFHIAHGGITYSLADSALAFASNSHGVQAVSIETSISHVKPVHEGDVLTARAIELSLGNRVGVYQVTVQDQHGTTVALFKGTVFRTGKDWELE